MSGFQFTAQRGLSLLGDEVGAWMADTTEETLAGSELVTNGGFATDTDWTKGSGWSIAAGVATHAAGTSSAIEQAISHATNKTYIITFDISGRTAGNIDVWLGGTNFYSYSSNGTKFLTVTPTGAGNLRFNAGATFDGSIDNVSVRLAVPDLSTAGNGLSVYGSITKSAVATGADLVGYSGFSAANYLEQPYNSDLDFGTGDFCYMGWIIQNPNTTAESILSRAYYPGAWSGALILLRTNVDGTIRFYISDDGAITSDVITTVASYDDGLPHLLAVLRSGSYFYIFVDGVLAASGAVSAAAGSLSNTSATLRFGLRTDGIYLGTNLTTTLWRAFNYAPTAAQIQSIYDDEKHLFKKYSYYTQKDQAYEFDLVLASANPSMNSIQTENTSLDGSVEVILDRTDEILSVTTDFLHRTDTNYIRTSQFYEFLYSTQAGESFLLDLYGTIAAPDSPEYYKRTNKNVSFNRQGDGMWFTSGFTARKVA